ncbi:diguanylate cyclase [Methylobacterium organophilum]|uniref:PAS domain-containing protein n=1 Tax=Methylobacterium organophilum TaxID=410 RepID=A0ABQ4T570_METOR|nr:diguanylate cyclase [Methylobacterium organophilum]GJE26805.1 hypothetical protein LKMONMHP_1657 [Methylobacterium organophilum]
MLSAALTAAGFVGTWDWNVSAGEVVLDDGAAALLMGDAALAGRSLPLEASIVRVHPADRDRIVPAILAAGREGGDFSLSFRVALPCGAVRRLLDRGQVARQADGSLRGFGTLLDITENPLGVVEPRTSDPLETAGELCALLRQTFAQAGGFRLKVLVDMLRIEIERERERAALRQRPGLH